MYALLPPHERGGLDEPADTLVTAVSAAGLEAHIVVSDPGAAAVRDQVIDHVGVGL